MDIDYCNCNLYPINKIFCYEKYRNLYLNDKIFCYENYRNWYLNDKIFCYENYRNWSPNDKIFCLLQKSSQLASGYKLGYVIHFALCSEIECSAELNNNTSLQKISLKVTFKNWRIKL